MSVNDCADDIFWTAEHFATELGMVVQHHELVSCGKNCLLSARSRSQQGLIWSNYNSFYYSFWTADPFATKLGLIVHIISQIVFWEIGLLCSRSRWQQKVNECLSRWYLLNCWTFYYQTLYGDASLWARLSSKKIGLLCSRFHWRII